MFASLLRKARVAPALPHRKNRSSRDDRGATIVEYALLLALIAILAVGGLVFAGKTVNNSLSGVGAQVATNGNANDTITVFSGDGQTAMVGSSFTNPIVALVENNGVPVNGYAITFSAPATGASATFPSCTPPTGNTCVVTTNASGQASVAIAANTKVGTYHITAGAQYVQGQATFTEGNTVGGANQLVAVSGSPQTAVVGTPFTYPLVALVEDQYNNPVPGVSVTFTAPPAQASATFQGCNTGNGTPVCTVTTDSNGDASPSLTANDVAGTYNVIITSNNLPTPAGQPETNAPDTSDETMSIVVGTPQGTLVQAAFATPLEVLVADEYGNPVSGVSVTFAAPNTTGSPGASFGGNPTSVVSTGATGDATAGTLTANDTPGSYNVTASASSVTNGSSPQTFALTNTTNGMFESGMTGQSVDTVGSWEAQVTVSVEDSTTNPLNGVTVSGVWTGSGTPVPATCVTAFNFATGNGTCTVNETGLNYNQTSATFRLTSLTKSSYGDTTTYTPTSPSFTVYGPDSIYTNDSLMAGLALPSGSGWQARVTVTVDSGTGNGQAGVKVVGKWADNTVATCTQTNFAGNCVFTETLPFTATSNTFTVTGLTLTGYTDTTSYTPTPPSITVASLDSIYTNDGLLAGASVLRPGGWQAQATVTVDEADGFPQGGVTVNGTWSVGNTPGTCTTANFSGSCTVNSATLATATTSDKFTVTGLVYGTWTDTTSYSPTPPSITIDGPDTMYTSNSLMTGTSSGGQNGWEGGATVEVYDGNGNPLGPVQVNGTWSDGVATYQVQCTTAANGPNRGMCTLEDGYTDHLLYTVGSVTFTVTSLVGTGATSGYVDVTGETPTSPSYTLYAPSADMYTNNGLMAAGTPTGAATGWQASVTITVDTSGPGNASAINVAGTWSDTAGTYTTSCATPTVTNNPPASASCTVTDGGGNALPFTDPFVTFTVTALSKSGYNDTTTYTAFSPAAYVAAPNTMTTDSGDLAGSSSGNTSGWQASVAVTVVDQDGIPLQGVTVTGDWSTAPTTPVTCQTGYNPYGQCTVTAGAGNTLLYTTTQDVFTVTGLAKTGYVDISAHPTVTVTAPPATISTDSAHMTGSSAVSGSGWQATVTITVVPAGPATAAGVSVTGDWSTAPATPVTCVTTVASCSVTDGSVTPLPYTTANDTFTVTKLTGAAGTTDTTSYTPTPPSNTVQEPNVLYTNTGLLAATGIGGTNTWQPSVTITVHDGAGATVNGVTVTGNFGGGPMNCDTGNNGQCTITDNPVSYSTTSVTFAVTKLARNTYTDITSYPVTVTVKSPPNFTSSASPSIAGKTSDTINIAVNGAPLTSLTIGDVPGYNSCFPVQRGWDGTNDTCGFPPVNDGATGWTTPAVFTPNLASGTATIKGTPPDPAGTYTYEFLITATNANGTTTQTMTVTVTHT